jgi:asparagine synthase (glutamine-hydrolysing)
MCGIAGIIDFSRPSAGSADALARMRLRLRHRGPDGEADAFGSFAALTHTRLAMLDPGHGTQPLRSDDGRYTLVYNGELFNEASLRAELGGSFRTRCDTETVLLAWQRWGPEAIGRLDGMFAFFVWDEVEQAGFAVRDPLGVKPLAYRTDVGFAFASEAQALTVLSPVAPRANLTAVVEALVAPAFSGVLRPAFADIEYLPPGHWLRVDADGVRVRRHFSWSPRVDPSHVVTPQALRDALRDATLANLRADAPLGIFLSGGLDSSLLAAFAAAAGHHPPVFTVTFEGQAAWDASTSAIIDADDTPFAVEVARELGLPHHLVRCGRGRIADEIAAVARSNDALPAWEQELTQRCLARAAAEAGVKGILVGDAADETHYGYHFLLDAVATSGPAAIMRRLGTVEISPEVDADPIGHLDRHYRAEVAEAGEDFAAPERRIAATTQLIVRRWLPRLLHNGDTHCMAFSVEPRVPFAARPVIDAAQRVSPQTALAGGQSKAHLRAAARGVLPESLRTRRKSALPKDQDVAAIYQRLARDVVADPHPLVRAVVSQPWLARLASAPRLDEGERAAVFRVLGLQAWARAHEVAAP